MNSRTNSMDIQQDSTDTWTWMCRDPHGSRAPVGVRPCGNRTPREWDPWGAGDESKISPCESKIPRTMEHTWEQGPGEWDTWEQDPREWDS